MKDAKPLVLSRLSRAAVAVLGQLIRAARTERGMSQAQLAQRLGVSRHTVMTLEKGHPRVSIGVVFEAAAIVGVPLLAEDERELARLAATLSALTQVLPARAGRRTKELNDDF